MSDNILPSQKIFSIKDARELSRKRLPKLVFDDNAIAIIKSETENKPVPNPINNVPRKYKKGNCIGLENIMAEKPTIPMRSAVIA